METHRETERDKMITLKGAEYAWLSHRLTTARCDYTQES